MSLNEVVSFELWDANSIDTVLSMEAIGLALPGKGWQTENIILNSMGGCLGRGNPLGASGADQLAEAVLQLRGQLGACQMRSFKAALVQSAGEVWDLQLLLTFLVMDELSKTIRIAFDRFFLI
jgi:hypothetical protein